MMAKHRNRGRPPVDPRERMVPGPRIRAAVKAALEAEAEERGESVAITADRYLRRVLKRQK